MPVQLCVVSPRTRAPIRGFHAAFALLPALLVTAIAGSVAIAGVRGDLAEDVRTSSGAAPRGGFCGDDICDLGGGETVGNCAIDCGCEADPAAFCGMEVETGAGCFCDESCVGFGDCCADKCAQCGGPECCGNGACDAGEDSSSCGADCGCAANAGAACGRLAATPGNCYCDANCRGFGDCCADVCTACTNPCATGFATLVESTAPTDTGADVRPHVATCATYLCDGDEAWMAVWNGNGPAASAFGSDNDIYFALSTNAGNTWSAAAPVNTNAAFDNGGDARPRVAAGYDHMWIATWASRNTFGGTIGPDFDILAATTTDDGATWTDPVVVNSNAYTDAAIDTLPDIAMSSTGFEWVIAWQSTDSLGGTIGTDLDLLYAVSTDDGATWSPRRVLNSSAATDGTAADILVDIEHHVDLGYMAVWSSKATLDNTIGSDFDILSSVAEFDLSGWSAPVPVNSFAAGPASIDKFARLSTNASVSMVVWASKDTLGGTIGTDFDILVSRSFDLGETWSPAAALNSTAATLPAAADSFPVVVGHQYYDSEGSVWTAAWHSNDTLGGTLGPDDDILVARSQDDGATWTPVAPLTSTSDEDSGFDRFVSVACDLDGRLVSAWHTNEDIPGVLGPDLEILSAGTGCACP